MGISEPRIKSFHIVKTWLKFSKKQKNPKPTWIRYMQWSLLNIILREVHKWFAVTYRHVVMHQVIIITNHADQLSFLLWDSSLWRQESALRNCQKKCFIFFFFFFTFAKSVSRPSSVNLRLQQNFHLLLHWDVCFAVLFQIAITAAATLPLCLCMSHVSSSEPVFFFWSTSSNLSCF